MAPDIREEHFVTVLSDRDAQADEAQGAIRGVLASRASNAADAIIPLGRIPHNAFALSAYIIPHSSQAGSATHYADVKVVNLGAAGSGTTVVASKTFSAAGASVASNTPGAMTMGNTAARTLTSGEA